MSSFYLFIDDIRHISMFLLPSNRPAVDKKKFLFGNERDIIYICYFNTSRTSIWKFGSIVCFIFEHPFFCFGCRKYLRDAERIVLSKMAYDFTLDAVTVLLSRPGSDADMVSALMSAYDAYQSHRLGADAKRAAGLLQSAYRRLLPTALVCGFLAHHV